MVKVRFEPYFVNIDVHKHSYEVNMWLVLYRSQSGPKIECQRKKCNILESLTCDPQYKQYIILI